VAGAVLAAASVGVGCGTAAREGGGAGEAVKRPELLCPRAGAERVEASSFRGNGKNDIVKVFGRSSEPGAPPSAVLLCKELDLSGDGRKDMLVFFDSRGRKLREEFDHDFDGLADMKSYYEGGQLVRQELDVDFDGKPDVVEYYEGGRRVRVEKLLTLPPAVAASAPAEPAAGGPARSGSAGATGPTGSTGATGTGPASSWQAPPSLPAPPVAPATPASDAASTQPATRDNLNPPGGGVGDPAPPSGR
jgi:hypothetical protein